MKRLVSVSWAIVLYGLCWIGSANAVEFAVVGARAVGMGGAELKRSFCSCGTFWYRRSKAARSVSPGARGWDVPWGAQPSRVASSSTTRTRRMPFTTPPSGHTGMPAWTQRRTKTIGRRGPYCADTVYPAAGFWQKAGRDAADCKSDSAGLRPNVGGCGRPAGRHAPLGAYADATRARRGTFGRKAPSSDFQSCRLPLSTSRWPGRRRGGRRRRAEGPARHRWRWPEPGPSGRTSRPRP